MSVKQPCWDTPRIGTKHLGEWSGARSFQPSGENQEQLLLLPLCTPGCPPLPGRVPQGPGLSDLDLWTLF